MRRFSALFLVVAVLIAGAALWWFRGLSPVNTSDKEPQSFVVRRGEGVRSIAANLKEQGIIRDENVFYLLVKQMGIEKKIQAGSYRLSPSQSAEQIAKTMTIGTQDVWITIPEGKRAEEIADILKESLPTYHESWREQLIANEGYLFPDTYLVPKDATVDSVISLLRNTFDAKYAEVENTAGLSQEEIVVIASMIEREANTDPEKYIISGVMQNRLGDGMALQIDATIQYAKGYSLSRKTWWAPVTLAEYQSVKSPYNTYLAPGLPPGPIANPGLEALKAAASPENTDYYYYIHDGTGQIRYARTIDEHNNNIRRYGL